MARTAGKDGANHPKRGTKPGSIRSVRLRLWWAVQEAAALLDQDDPDMKLRAISALSTAAGAYGNLTKTHTLETEVEALQRDLRDLREALSRPASRPDRSAAPTVN